MFFGLFFIFFYLIIILLSNAAVALELVGLWFTFRKMGLPGWKGIIPFYGTYVLFQKLWEVKQFWKQIIYLGIYIVIYSVGISLTIAGCVMASEASSGSAGLVVLVIGILLMLASLVTMVLAFIISYRLYQRLARAFGLKNAWTWGLLFLSFVFLPILGFHKGIVYRGVETTA